MKKCILFLAFFCLAFFLNGQSNSVTNNNTIIIHGNVYYFQPSNMPSSPQPTVNARNFINPGSWYGENAARAWASISDWVIERCRGSDRPVTGRINLVTGQSIEQVYISQVHAYKGGTDEAERHHISGLSQYDGVIIYYWIVPHNEKMENGRRETRTFWF